jgi:hypothetical protein
VAALEETEPLINRIHALHYEKGKEVSGLQIMALFLLRRVQPLQPRISTMWTYARRNEPTRVSKEDLSTNELEKTVRSFTRLTEKDDVPSSCRVTPFDKKNLPPAVSFRVLILFC